jgi:hypothetical protein
MNFRKLATLTTLLSTAVLAAGIAHAGPHVQWQIAVETPVIRLPGHVSLPLPPILVPRAVVTTPYRDERHGGAPSRWDADGDGVPNRADRVYNPRWDRDGDGIPNRYDARPNDPRPGRGGHRYADRHHDAYTGHDRHEQRRDWRDDRRGR